MILFPVLDISGAIAVRLTALLADKWFVIASRVGIVLQGGVALQQPGGREGREAHSTAATLRLHRVSRVRHAVVAEVPPQATGLQREERRPQWESRARASRRNWTRNTDRVATHVQAHLE